MKTHKWLLVLFLAWIVGLPAPAVAQSSAEGMNTVEFSSTTAASSSPEMADVMRRDGKIYIVVAVLVTLLLGVLLYLIHLDKKVARLERELRQ